MSKFRLWLCVSIVLLIMVVFSPIIAEANNKPVLEFTGQYWAPTLSGQVLASNNSQTINVNLRSDLGLKAQKGVPGGVLVWRTGPHSRLRASYIFIHYNGSQTLSRNIVFKKRTYTISSNIDSKLTAHYFTLGWMWDFIAMGHDRFNAGLVIDVKGISLDTTVKAKALGLSDTQSIIGGLPTAGVSFQYKVFRPLTFYGEIDGLPAGHYGYFVETQGGLKFDLTRNLTLSGGYHMVALKFNFGDKNSGRLSLKGPFAQLTLKF